MVNSGNTAVATNGDGAVPVLSVAGYGTFDTLVLVNEGATPGFWSTDQVNWQRLPAGPSSITDARASLTAPFTVYVKRVPGGSDLSGVWGWVH